MAGLLIVAGVGLGLIGWVVSGQPVALLLGGAVGAGAVYARRYLSARQRANRAANLLKIVDGVTPESLATLRETFRRLSARPVLARVASDALAHLDESGDVTAGLLHDFAARIDPSEREHWRVRAGVERAYRAIIEHCQSIAEELVAIAPSDADSLRAEARLAERRLQRGKISREQAASIATRWQIFADGLERAEQRLVASRAIMNQLLVARQALRQAPVMEELPEEIADLARVDEFPESRGGSSAEKPASGGPLKV